MPTTPKQYFNSRDILIRLEFAKIAYIAVDGNYSYTVMSNKLKVCDCMLEMLSQRGHTTVTFKQS